MPRVGPGGQPEPAPRPFAYQRGLFLHAERIQESGDNYRAHNPGSGASGAYQFLQGTWEYAMAMAGLGGSAYRWRPAADAPARIQDAAASALMTHYYNEFGRNWYNVAEAWYGGPGAVGHPSWGGGPGYPDVGQYAADVMAIYRRLGGSGSSSGGGGKARPGIPNDFLANPSDTQLYNAAKWANTLNTNAVANNLRGIIDNTKVH